MGFFSKKVDWISAVLFPSSARGRRERIEEQIRKAMDFYARGQYDDADRSFLQSVRIAEEFGAESLELAEHLSRLGELHHSMGKYSEAEPLLSRSLEIRQNRFGDQAYEICGGLNDLALLHYTQGKYEQGEQLYQRLQSILESRPQPNDRELAVCLDNYAALLRKQQREEESGRLQKRATEIRERAKARTNSRSDR